MKKKYLYNLLLFLFLGICPLLYGQTKESEVGVSKYNESIEGLHIYPNPVLNNKVHISTNRNLYKEIRLFDVLGKEIFSTKIYTNELILPDINPGVYIIKIIEKEATATRKLIIK